MSSNNSLQKIEVSARDGNHVKAFMAECCITGVAEDWSVSESIYGAYLTYCATNGHKSPLPKNVLSFTICNMGLGVSARRGRSEDKVVCGQQGIRLRGEQDLWMTDEEEQSRYGDDAPLVGTDELLLAVAGRLMITKRAINMKEEPLEPVQEDVLLVLMAETGNSIMKETHPGEAYSDEEGQGGINISNPAFCTLRIGYADPYLTLLFAVQNIRDVRSLR